MSGVRQVNQTHGQTHAAGTAPWAQNYSRKKLPRAAELTLEKVYERWQQPPVAIIDSLWDLHQIPRYSLPTECCIVRAIAAISESVASSWYQAPWAHSAMMMP